MLSLFEQKLIPLGQYQTRNGQELSMVRSCGGEEAFYREEAEATSGNCLIQYSLSSCTAESLVDYCDLLALVSIS